MIKNKQSDAPIIEKYTNIFENLEGLIDTNVCNYMVDCQLKKDRIAMKTTQFLDEHLNVV